MEKEQRQAKATRPVNAEAATGVRSVTEAETAMVKRADDIAQGLAAAVRLQLSVALSPNLRGRMS